MAEKQSIHEIVREMENQDKVGNVLISKYVSFDLRKTVEQIDAYLNSKHISGDKDSLNRDKPFFNIVTAAVNVWYRATDIDRKNIRIRATKAEHYILAFLATIHLQEWMRKNNFGLFLNDWGRTLARYGSAVLKFVEKSGEFHVEVIPWDHLIIDPIDFENNVKIEKLWLTPAQLRKNKAYDPELVEELIDSLSIRQTMDGQTKDLKSQYVPIYEVHGELPLSFLTGKESDEDTMVQQMHVVSFQGKTSEPYGRNEKGWNDYTLFSGRESRDPYMITHLIEENGRSLAIGAVEHLFDAQWMINHSQKQMKDQLDLASKLLFQTSDGNFVGQNALTNLENGQILIHTPGNPLTQISNRPDIAAMQAFQAQWQSQGNAINGISEAMLGAQPPSGTAWRQTQALLQESHSLFEQMTENKGLYLEKIMREFVIPFLKKQMDTTEEISATLDDYQIDQLDAMYVPNEAKRRVANKIKDTILSGHIYEPSQLPGQLAGAQEQIQQELAPLGNQRFIKPGEVSTTTWQKALEGLEWELEIDVTGEAKDTQAAMATLTTVFQTLIGNPGALQDPNVKFVFGRILEMAGGISPVEIKASAQPAAQPASAPSGAPAMAGLNVTQ